MIPQTLFTLFILAFAAATAVLAAGGEHDEPSGFVQTVGELHNRVASWRAVVGDAAETAENPVAWTAAVEAGGDEPQAGPVGSGLPLRYPFSDPFRPPPQTTAAASHTATFAVSHFDAVRVKRAILGGDFGFVRAVLVTGVSASLVLPCGNSLLHVAAMCDPPELSAAFTAMLIDAGADVEAKNDRKETPLTVAALRLKNDAADLLVRAGARSQWFLEPLELAVRHRDYQLFALLLDNMRDARMQTSMATEILSTAVVRSRDVGLFLLALNRNVDASAVYSGYLAGNNPRTLNEDMLFELLKRCHETDARKRNGMGLAAIHIAAEKGYPLLIDYMINRAGVHVDERDAAGRTALHIAALNNRESAARRLIMHGADIDALNAQRLTPLQIVEQRHFDKPVHRTLLRAALKRAGDM